MMLKVMMMMRRLSETKMIDNDDHNNGVFSFGSFSTRCIEDDDDEHEHEK